nr:MAG TPA: hypothetical protein [Caudoviricetes sp.]
MAKNYPLISIQWLAWSCQTGVLFKEIVLLQVISNFFLCKKTNRI